METKSQTLLVDNTDSTQQRFKYIMAEAVIHNTNKKLDSAENVSNNLNKYTCEPDSKYFIDKTHSTNYKHIHCDAIVLIVLHFCHA